jgi:cytochrome c5
MKGRTLMQIVLMASLLSTALTLAQASSPKHAGAAPAKSQVKADAAKQPDMGQRKFDANCGRCHSFPEQLSPSLTGTVVRHMRVRANLSAQDEQDILRFLAP